MANTFQQHALPADEADDRWEVVTELYYEKLNDLLSVLDFDRELKAALTVKHYLNGAAVYVNGAVCVSWSPVGLAFKLPAGEIAELIANGQAKSLKYFAKRPIKKDYVLFDKPESKRQAVLRDYFIRAAELSLATPTEIRD